MLPIQYIIERDGTFVKVDYFRALRNRKKDTHL